MNSILHFDIAAVVILVFFLLLGRTRERFVGRSNKILYVLTILLFLSTVFDLTSGYFENSHTISPKIIQLTYVLNSLFFIPHNMILPTLVLYMYSSTDVWHLFKTKKILKYTWVAGCVIPVLILIGNGWLIDVFWQSGNNTYNRGPGVTVFYILAGLYLLWLAIFAIRYRKIIRPDKVIVLSFSLAVTIIGVIIQAMNPKHLVEMFATTIGLLFFMIVARREDSMLDSVSGAYKRISAVEHFSRNFETKKPVVLTFIKIVNHANIRLYLGQESYSAFLRQFTDMLRGKASASDYKADIFYMDGGLFAFVSEDMNAVRAGDVARSVKAVLANPLIVSDLEVRPDVCICIVKCPEEIGDFSTLYTLSSTFSQTMPNSRDVAFYADYMNDNQFMIKNELDTIIKRGIENRSFEMHYQPIYSIAKDRFMSAEALLRLKDEKYGYIPPALFIPFAEMNGAIHEIGDFVIEAVARFISMTDMDMLGLDYVEINLSAAQCIEVDLADKIITLMEDYGVRSDQICFEITETIADLNPEIVDRNVTKLHDYGIRFALDDYGTGYSNIKRVTSLPIDQVKLDKSFVDEINVPHMWDVISDTVEMLKRIGKEVLVEGVETLEVAERFKNMECNLFQGCELIQGFYYCKPLPEEEFKLFLTSHRTK